MLRPRNIPTDEQIEASHPELAAEQTALNSERTPTAEASADWNRRCEDFRRRWQEAELPLGACLAYRDASGRYTTDENRDR